MNTIPNLSNENVLKNKLKNLGFEHIEFEPKINNRFIVDIEDIPSYIVKSVSFPSYNSDTKQWYNFIGFQLYNPIGLRIEERLINILDKKKIDIKIKLLTSEGDVDTTWEIEASKGILNFNCLSWEDSKTPNVIKLSLQVESVKLIY